MAGTGAAAPPATGRGGPFSTPVRLRWLGVAGWEIVIGGDRSILFDPYLSRMPCWDRSGGLDPRLPLRQDRAVVERVADVHLAGPPELVLVSHGHFDHLADVPQLLARPDWRRARIRTVCDETVRHLLTALGTPPTRVADVIQVTGGEYLQFDGYTVEVFRSLHSQFPDHGYFAPGRLIAAPDRRPDALGDLVEGDTLAFQVSVDGGPRILLMGAGNFVERELSGIRPDIALVPMTSHAAVHRYVERLLHATGHPPLLIPTHHDDLTTPLGLAVTGSTPVGSPAARELSRRAPAGSRILDPRHLEAVDVDTVLG
ncbi:MBL fold metallo-hydrolase [Streptomyces sp. NPDC046203]|uniref:MBL fold metallo-hydrolase n=1 Tax=Streptomyces sp. NPDC046203 TaxID=3154602 RepID=UPI0033C75E27